MAERVIHIHEDDGRCATSTQLGGEADVQRDMEAAAGASERNRAPSGIGWTAVHVIQAPDITYLDTGLRLTAAEAVLAPIMPRVKRFNATISAAIGFDERDPLGAYESDAWCLGFDEDCFIKLEPRGELVERIWFSFWGTDAGRAAALRRAIEALDSLAPSLVADYYLHMTGRVADAHFLDAYFAAHLRRGHEIKQAEEAWTARNQPFWSRCLHALRRTFGR